MAYYYADFNTGASGNSGADWTNAKDTIENGLALCTLGGDTLFIRANTSETFPDTQATPRSIAIPSNSVFTNPVRVIGIKAGITREGAAILPSDLAVTSGEQPVIEVTGTGNDLTFTGNDLFLNISHVNFTVADRFIAPPDDSSITFYQCAFDVDEILGNGGDSNGDYIDCEITLGKAGVTGGFRTSGGQSINVRGGTISGTVTNLINASSSRGWFDFTGVDFSGATITNLSLDNFMTSRTVFRNCRIAYTNVLDSDGTGALNGSVELIGCNNLTSKGPTGSYQDYTYADAHGAVANEGTVIRTGGANDGADGGFSYKLTPWIDSTLEGSFANIKSPWMSVWVPGSASTLTVYICNSSASTDYTEEEVWCEFYTPNASDFAWHDLTLDPALNDFISESSTALTDDTGSTWGTGGNNHQKFTTGSITPGYEGFAYARVHFAKRFAASPETLYVDPKIEVT